MNIPQITQCFSSFSVTFIEDRFCLFRTWSFTLFKNDVDPNEFPMMNCFGIAHLWRQTTGVTVLSGFSSSSIMTCLCSREKKRDWNSCVLAQEQTTGVSVLSSIDLSAFHSWEDQALSSSHLNSVLSTNFQQFVRGGTFLEIAGLGSPVLSWFWVVFSKTKIKQSDPINREREPRPFSIQRPKRWFRILLNCVTLKFVFYTSNLSEQMYDFQKRTMCSSRSRFCVLKISCKIGVLKQSQSAFFCRITHIPNLFVFTCVMNVWNQTMQAFCPFCNRSCKFVHWP